MLAIGLQDQDFLRQVSGYVCEGAPKGGGPDTEKELLKTNAIYLPSAPIITLIRDNTEECSFHLRVLT